MKKNQRTGVSHCLGTNLIALKRNDIVCCREVVRGLTLSGHGLTSQSASARHAWWSIASRRLKAHRSIAITWYGHLRVPCLYASCVIGSFMSAANDTDNAQTRFTKPILFSQIRHLLLTLTYNANKPISPWIKRHIVLDKLRVLVYDTVNRFTKMPETSKWTRNKWNHLTWLPLSPNES